MKYGLGAGAAMIAWTLLEYALGMHTTRFALGKYTGWGTGVILLVMLWRLLRLQFARRHRSWLPVGAGMFHGALASFVAGLVFCLFLNVYVTFVNREWPDLYLEWQVAQMRAAGDTEAAIRTVIRSFRWRAGPVGRATLTIGLYPLLGSVISAVLTLWLNLRHKKRAPVS